MCPDQGKIARFLPGESEAEGSGSKDAQQAGTRQRGRARPAKQPIKPKPGTIFHAKDHMPMTEAEVAQIFADPRSLPDSDDEEDLDEWKVSLRAMKLAIKRG